MPVKKRTQILSCKDIEPEIQYSELPTCRSKYSILLSLLPLAMLYFGRKVSSEIVRLHNCNGLAKLQDIKYNLTYQEISKLINI